MSDTQHRPPADRPQPNTVLNEPATPDNCAHDYATGAPERHGLDNVAHRQYGNG